MSYAEKRPSATPDCNANGMLDQFDIDDGTSLDANVNGIPDECELPACPPDINGDRAVNVTDLLAVINAWGACAAPCPPRCAADIAPVSPMFGDCNVNVTDLLAVINAWGSCP